MPNRWRQHRDSYGHVHHHRTVHHQGGGHCNLHNRTYCGENGHSNPHHWGSHHAAAAGGWSTSMPHADEHSDGMRIMSHSGVQHEGTGYAVVRVSPGDTHDDDRFRLWAAECVQSDWV